METWDDLERLENYWIGYCEVLVQLHLSFDISLTPQQSQIVYVSSSFMKLAKLKLYWSVFAKNMCVCRTQRWL